MPLSREIAEAMKSSRDEFADLVERSAVCELDWMTPIHDRVVLELERGADDLPDPERIGRKKLVQLYSIALMRLAAELHAGSILRMPVESVPWRGRAA